MIEEGLLLNSRTLRGLAQQLRAGRGRDFEDVKRHRDERVVADEPGNIHDTLVAQRARIRS